MGFGVCSKAVFSLSNCFDLIVVRGPLPRLPFKDSSSGIILSSCCMIVAVVVVDVLCDAADVTFSSFSI